MYSFVHRYLDTPGIMGRDLQQCRHFAASWYGDSLDPAVPDVFKSARLYQQKK